MAKKKPILAHAAPQDVEMSTGMTGDEVALALLKCGRVVVDLEAGLVFSMSSNFPSIPLGGKVTKKGYLRAGFHFRGHRPRTIMLHRIICIAAYGLPEGERKHVNHKNGIKNDNRAENLEWCTTQENATHAKENNLLRPVCGEDRANSLLTWKIVNEIRAMSHAGVPTSAIAQRFSINTWHVRRVVTGADWKDESYSPPPVVQATHCKRGHEFTPENTYLSPSGDYRTCRECLRTTARKRWEAIKEIENAKRRNRRSKTHRT